MQRRAFTLIELMIVLSLILVLSVLVVPSLWGRVAKEQASSVLRELADAATHCRTRAMRTGTPVALVIMQDDASENENGRDARLVGVSELWDESRAELWTAMPIGSSSEFGADESSDGLSFDDSSAFRLDDTERARETLVHFPAGWLTYAAQSRERLLDEALSIKSNRSSARPMRADDARALTQSSAGIGGLADAQPMGGAVAVYLSDGSAIPGPVVLLAQSPTNVHDIFIGRWSGIITTERALLHDEQQLFDDEDFGSEFDTAFDTPSGAEDHAP